MAFTSALVLAYFTPSTPLMIETDAPDYTIIDMLSTTYDDGQLHSVMFYS